MKKKTIKNILVGVLIVLLITLIYSAYNQEEVIQECEFEGQTMIGTECKTTVFTNPLLISILSLLSVILIPLIVIISMSRYWD
ncbi:MAG: hypothetical protein ACOCP8_01105 [archaeon]